jgi:hypothetical protein
VGFEMFKHCRVIGSDSSVALDTLACMTRGVKVKMNLKVQYSLTENSSS